MTTFIFNTTIAPTPGLTYHTRTISAEHARRLIEGVEVTSAIGHDATAAIASTLLGRDIKVNRIAAQMAAGDSAICIKLKGRPPEGVILTTEEVEAIGYDIVLMTACDQNKVAQECYLRTEPNAPWEDYCPPLEEGAGYLLKSFDSWVATAKRLDLESGRHYNALLPFDSLRAGLVRLCIDTIEDVIAIRRYHQSDAPVDPDDIRSLRESLVSRLLDVIGERGEQVT